MSEKPYICKVCKKGFKTNKELKQHGRKKIPCVPPGEKHKCRYCGKNSTTKSNLIRHENEFCKVRREQVEAENNAVVPEGTVAILMEQIKHLTETLNELKHTNTTNNNYNSVGTVNNVNNTHNGDNNLNIMVNNHDNPNLDYITNEVFHRLVKENIEDVGLNAFFKLSCFNPEHPENMSFYLKNLQKDEAYIKENNKWKLDTVGQVIGKIYNVGVQNYMHKTNNCREFFIEKDGDEGKKLMKKITSYMTPMNDSKGNIKISNIPDQVRTKKYIENQMGIYKNVMKNMRYEDEMITA